MFVVDNPVLLAIILLWSGSIYCCLLHVFLQVNGTFDMPQVRMCGVSTPYVRVYLNQEDKATKEPRSAFLDLSCKRLCAFDRLTLEDAKNATLSFLVLDYDRFSRSDFIGEVTLPLSDVDLEKGATISRHLQPKTLEKVPGYIPYFRPVFRGRRKISRQIHKCRCTKLPNQFQVLRFGLRCWRFCSRMGSKLKVALRT